MGNGPRSVVSPLDRDHEWALRERYPRFLIDHNLPWYFGQTFRNVGYRTVAARELDLDAADDLEVIEWCGNRKLVWVTEDIDTRRRGQYVALIQQLRVSAVFVRAPPAKGWPPEMTFEVLAKNMRGLQDAFSKNAPRYFRCGERGAARELTSFGAGISPRRATPSRR